MHNWLMIRFLHSTLKIKYWTFNQLAKNQHKRIDATRSYQNIERSTTSQKKLTIFDETEPLYSDSLLVFKLLIFLFVNFYAFKPKKRSWKKLSHVEGFQGNGMMKENWCK